MSAAVEQAWRALEGAARDYAATGDMAQAKALAAAADAYARVRWTERSGAGGTKPSTGKGARSGHVIPFGNTKGTAIEDATAKDLNWIRERIASTLDDPDKERYRPKNQALLDAIITELASR